MELIAASQAKDDDLRYMVRTVKVVKLFYVTTGRNAWWSTWITRYSPGCMHSTIESAKAFCEPSRVQGMVFYIDELPSLAFVVPERALVISEINTDEFLGRLDFTRLTSLTTVFPVSSMTLRQMTYVFRPESPLWPGVRHICAISCVALNDYFQTEGTKEAAIVNYHEHSNMVHSLAVKLIQDGAPNDQNVFFITSDICQNNWP